jgi:hypothetical protein
MNIFGKYLLVITTVLAQIKIKKRALNMPRKQKILIEGKF